MKRETFLTKLFHTEYVIKSVAKSVASVALLQHVLQAANLLLYWISAWTIGGSNRQANSIRTQYL